jgi:transposase
MSELGPDYRRPAIEEIEARTLMVRRLLSQGKYDGEVKKTVAAHFKISARTVERYLRRARDEMVKEAGKDRGELRAEGYSFYREIRGNRKASDKDRLKAQERIDKLLGLEAPQKVQVSSAELDRLIEEELERVGRGGEARLPEPPSVHRNGEAAAG